MLNKKKPTNCFINGRGLPFFYHLKFVVLFSCKMSDSNYFLKFLVGMNIFLKDLENSYHLHW